MTFTLTINCDNAAFAHPFDELALIFNQLVSRMATSGFRAGSEWPLHDINGNRVGTATLTEES